MCPRITQYPIVNKYFLIKNKNPICHRWRMTVSILGTPYAISNQNISKESGKKSSSRIKGCDLFLQFSIYELLTADGNSRTCCFQDFSSSSSSVNLLFFFSISLLFSLLSCKSLITEKKCRQSKCYFEEVLPN